MVLVLNNIIFLFNSMLLLCSNISAVNLKHKKYALDPIDEKESFDMPRHILRKTRLTTEMPAKYDERDGLEHEINDPDSHFTNSRNHFTKRNNNRATQAGYTNNVDTCKLYNKNLENVWMALAKFMGSEGNTPDNMALHNIILLVKAYLDHHSNILKNDEKTLQGNDIRSQGNVPEMLSAIKEILDKKSSRDNEETSRNIIDTIVNHVMMPKGNNYETCIRKSTEKLEFTVIREYQRYIEFSTCNVNNSKEKTNPEINFERMNLRDAKKFIRRWVEEPKTDCINNARNAFLEMLRAIVIAYINDIQCL